LTNPTRHIAVTTSGLQTFPRERRRKKGESHKTDPASSDEGKKENVDFFISKKKKKGKDGRCTTRNRPIKKREEKERGWNSVRLRPPTGKKNPCLHSWKGETGLDGHNQRKISEERIKRGAAPCIEKVPTITGEKVARSCTSRSSLRSERQKGSSHRMPKKRKVFSGRKTIPIEKGWVAYLWRPVRTGKKRRVTMKV